MVTANLKPRRNRAEPRTNVSVELEEASDTANPQEQCRCVAFLWMQVTDALREQVGFLPGQQVLFSVDHRYGHITITLDCNYRIASRYMTGSEAEAMLQRRSKRM